MKLKQLNGIQPLILLFTPVSFLLWHLKMSCMKKTYCLLDDSATTWQFTWLSDVFEISIMLLRGIHFGYGCIVYHNMFTKWHVK